MKIRSIMLNLNSGILTMSIFQLELVRLGSRVAGSEYLETRTSYITQIYLYI